MTRGETMSPTDTAGATVVRAARDRTGFAERMREACGIVLVAPGTNLKGLYAAYAVGAPLKLIGIGGMTVGAVLAAVCLVADPAGFVSFLGERFTAGWGENAVLSTGVTAFFGGVGSYLVGVGLIGGARLRAWRDGVLIAAEMVYAPKNISTSMTRALTAAETIRGSVAYREGWLAGFDLDGALWELARYLRSGIRLRDRLGTGPSTPALDEQVVQSRAALEKCVVRVREGADRLASLADRVEAFDRELAAPARRAELETARELRAQRNAERMGRLSAATADVEAIEPVLGRVADRMTGVLDAYDEAPRKRD